MKTMLISACLLKIPCRYDGKRLRLNPSQQKLINKLLNEAILIPICPEQLGGLSTPRPPAKIKNNQIINEKGIDVTKNFHWGAKATLKIARLFGIKSAYFKKRSPSCGRNGITTQYLKKIGVKVHFI